ncbi:MULTISPECIES: TRAP transporter small permease subunit [unclassified Mesorhizobium]|uniref:TRAP transporter small permease subunit n=1 Tax=unclassified Mesorhizobium TaxID=325217 RepID=UPI001FD347E7|nr:MULTISPECIES: TRAP transporter small permease [unclassified Mesorhizobium]
MQVEPNRTGAATNGPPGRRNPMPLWNRWVDGLAALGTIMIVFLMAIIVADVIARNIMGASLPLIAELGALTVVLIVFLQLGTAVRNDRLASTEFFMTAMSERWPGIAAGIRATWDLAGAVLCAGIAWSSWGIFRRDVEHSEFIGVIGVLTMPTSPFRALIFLGAAVASAQFLLMAATRLRRAAKQEGGAE